MVVYLFDAFCRHSGAAKMEWRIQEPVGRQCISLLAVLPRYSTLWHFPAVSATASHPQMLVPRNPNAGSTKQTAKSTLSHTKQKNDSIALLGQIGIPITYPIILGSIYIYIYRISPPKKQRPKQPRCFFHSQKGPHLGKSKEHLQWPKALSSFRWNQRCPTNQRTVRDPLWIGIECPKPTLLVERKSFDSAVSLCVCVCVSSIPTWGKYIIVRWTMPQTKKNWWNDYCSQDLWMIGPNTFHFSVGPCWRANISKPRHSPHLCQRCPRRPRCLSGRWHE